MSVIRIDRCFDSHVHWQATGEFKSRWNLSSLKSEADILNLKFTEQNVRSGWLLGHSWDHNLWANKQYPTRQTLDQLSHEGPIVLSRVDAHAVWMNTEAFRRLDLIDDDGFPKGELLKHLSLVVRDNENRVSGVLIDDPANYVIQKIPKPTRDQSQNYLLLAQKLFNLAGFTHIRDLTCTQEQFQIAIDLEQKGELSLFVEEFFHVYDLKKLNDTVDICKQAKREKSKQLRVKGIKVFFDGALGSEGALLSKPYKCRSHHHGFQLMTEAELKQVMQTVWSANLELAVHVIGDEAAHKVMQVAALLLDSDMNSESTLHLEHVEILRPETIVLMKNKKIFCHMQPCHWLTDKKWVDEKIGDLKRYLFPWKPLLDSHISFDFGSDSPIEPPSIENNFTAIKDCERHDILGLGNRFAEFHSHPDIHWGENTFSEFENLKPKLVSFRGQCLP